MEAIYFVNNAIKMINSVFNQEWRGDQRSCGNLWDLKHSVRGETMEGIVRPKCNAKSRNYYTPFSLRPVSTKIQGNGHLQTEL